MSDYVLNVPEEVYAGARKIAEATAQSVDRVLIETLRLQFADLPMLPPRIEPE